MTETATFPFVDEDLAPFPEETEGFRSKRNLILAGGLGAVVLAAGGYFLFGGSGGGGTESFVPIVHHAPRVAAAPVKPVVKAAVKLPAPYKEQLGRDPFKALFVVPAAAAAPVGAAPGAVTVGGVAPAGTTPVPAGTTPTSTTPTSTTPTTVGTGTSVGTGATPVAPVDKTYKLVLVRVYGSGKDQTAVYSIDGKQQVAKLGSKFGPTSEIVLLSIQQGPKAGQFTTVLQVGDGDPFDVITGVATYVR